MPLRAVHSRLIAGLAGAALGLCAASPLAAQDAPIPVELELVLAVDGSWSVDQAEFALQMQGIAAAFRDRRVIGAIEGAAGGIAVSVVVWSSARRQEQVVPFIHVTDSITALALSARIGEVGRGERGQTAIADALLYCAERIERNVFDGERRTIDISGDGINNQGRELGPVRGQLKDRGITVNGLPILNDHPLLDYYYENEVIVGDAAFTEVAQDYDTFGEAMLRKLIREILGDRIAFNSERREPVDPPAWALPEREPPSRM